MRNMLTTALAVSILAVPIASASEFLGGNVISNVNLTTDYAFRGTTQTDEAPAIQGGFDYEHTNGFNAGVWASNIDFNNTNAGSIELDVYAGYNHNITDNLSVGTSVIAYMYPGS